MHLAMGTDAPMMTCVRAVSLEPNPAHTECNLSCPHIQWMNAIAESEYESSQLVSKQGLSEQRSG